MSSLVRSPRFSAIALLTAAVLGLVVANSPVGPGLERLLDAHLPLGAVGLDLSIAHWISDGLLAVFFLLVAIELKQELVDGELSNPKTAIIPAIAAVGGVLVPAGIFLLVTAGTQYTHGWPIPTATDIAFALGVLAMFGRGLPSGIRVFLLALAVLDDLIAIIIIAVVFAHDTDFLALAGAVVTLAVFWLLGRMLRPGRNGQTLLIVAMVVVGLLTWWLVYHSGVHATIAGVALGLALPRRPGHTLHENVEPWSNAIVLPVFAFASAAVVIPAVGIGELSPTFWAVVIALPVGKVIGITLFGAVATRIFRSPGRSSLSFFSIITVGVLGGIGFTVSLLMNELAFARNEEILDEGVLAVLVGSGIAIVASAVVVTLRARAYRGRRELSEAEATE
ncbi:MULTISPECIES: Na+/H+ antiporter NhaA [unclassified Curtobacterium]|uniref:Na+/H+ antiporter NhaA n=1 Tax=unclassified Curtobacterium TaxID=257496 RepID=UPI000F49156D|nr:MULTISPECIES: Na+/H+ antiporter NhaA [unclassified Curtobacterium]ROQ17340.1 sodium/proton antiporter (NhaA family) [Curtobacterium sp. PhB171]ROQ29415.1 sodium/proton antiporter (NhaA family) [Curtobacterium sp. PhB170]ROS45439.1 sodium/proton antiporter (NhaA family) [Curtobacterium sp. PhB131]ROS65853.1 sodium/proton antiporter (NhaA family) [Curtobacterium sp. PhB141]